LDQGWRPETPRTVKQVQKHVRTLRKSLKRKTILTPSPTNIAAVQMAMAAEHAIYAYQLAQKRMGELEALVEVKKRKKTTSRSILRTVSSSARAMSVESRWTKLMRRMRIPLLFASQALSGIVGAVE
jgi:hypothetical protein